MKYMIIIWSLLVWITDAHAYLDPGTGSLFIQSVIAVFAGGIFVLKTYWYKIKAKLFSRSKDKRETSSDE